MTITDVLNNRSAWCVETSDVLDGLRSLPTGCVQCCVTSPPYFGLRDYQVTGQIGLEPTPAEFIAKMVEVFGEVHRVLRDDGVLWLNIGDSYNAYNGNRGKAFGENKNHHEIMPSLASGHGLTVKSLKPKDLIGIPWLLAFALRDAGWYLRDAIIWAKPNAMPGSQDDRCSSSYETVFQFSKSARYFADFDAIKTPPRESTMVRLAQDVQAQAGSARANGGTKTNGPMKAVGTDKQRGHSRRHAGFNDRWDKMSREEQQAAPAMMRNVWFIATASYAKAHFAVMPDELARRCIAAGTSECGCCAACGAAIKPIVTKNRVRTRPGAAAKADDSGRANRDSGRHVTHSEVAGWKRSCKCETEATAPCLVLDPFNGAGTTGVVARRMDLRYIGFELNPEYAAMARERISEDAPLFNRQPA